MATLQPQVRWWAELPDPLYFLWRKLTSVRAAIVLILFLVALALTAVIIPQVPPQFSDDAVQIQEHVDLQRGTWGPFTNILAEFPWFYDARGGIFNLFNQPYWYGLVAILALSITTCTVSRFPPIRRTVLQPPRRVPDAYFERARHRYDFTTPADADVIAATLRRQHFKVQSEERNGATYLFADRYQWAQFSTFVMHLALILLVAGTMITKFGGEEFQFWLGEGESRPLFATAGERQQVQIIVDDASARFSDEGQALDFRSAVRVTSGGGEIAAGQITVNGPLRFGGYRIHQSEYWEHGAALQIHDTRSGQVLYSETLQLTQQFVGPRITVADALSGAVFAEEVIRLGHEVVGIPGSGYQLIPLDAERSVALVLIPDEDGQDFRFFYSMLPLAADSAAGATLDGEALRLGQPPLTAPRVRLSDSASGALLLDAVVPLAERVVEGRSAARLGVLPLGAADTATAGTATAGTVTAGTIAVGYDESVEPWRLFYFNTEDEGQRGLLRAGQRVRLGAVTLEYVGEEADRSQHGTLAVGESQRVGAVQLAYGGVEAVFFRVEADLPGAAGEALILMERFGQARTAEGFDARGGENVKLVRFSATSEGDASRPARLGLGLGGDQPRVDLDEGESAVIGDYRYTFLGPREFTGLTVRRDPGASLFWAALGLGIAAMLVTFFVPRRRIWARITAQRTHLAGMAGHGINLRPEFERFSREVKAPDAPPDEDGDDT